jgi:hypothetical protein
MTPRRIAWNRFSGERFPTGTRLVGRGTRFGNPFTVSRYGRAEALRLFRAWLRGEPEAVARAHADGWPTRWPYGADLVAVIRTELVGHDVVCPGCRLDQQCHGDIVLAVAAGTEP